MSKLTNVITDTDSYKLSHFMQYPAGVEYVSMYGEARKAFNGGQDGDHVLFFGLQAILKEYFTTPITQADIDEAAEIAAAHGEPFNRMGWEYILKQHGGLLPIEIQAVPEGTVLASSNVLFQVRNTDPVLPWLPSYVETALLRVWYPITVSTQSFMIKKLIKSYLKQTADNTDGLLFKLHDFGSRGVSSNESAAIGGAAHLVNFRGTDTMAALLHARRYYGAAMAGFSIPASEHSTITSWGRDGEVAAYRNMLKQYGGKFPLVACVSDSYNIFNAVENLWGGELKEEVINSGSVLVVRPDSGDPVDITLKVVEKLGEKFGFTLNSKGYKVLHPSVRIIQGDGVNYNSIDAILSNFEDHGWSADNIAFGMGGALLQSVNRDTMSFAYKASAISTNGGLTWVDVFKQPITDTGKVSKKGRLALDYNQAGELITVRENQVDPNGGNQLRTVFKDGKLLFDDDFETIRARSDKAL